MSFKREINKIEKLINENKLQEAVHKMIELDSKIRERYGENDDAILEIFNDMDDNTIHNGEEIKYTSEGDFISDEGDINCLESLEDDTYYKVVYSNYAYEVEIYNLTMEILKVVLDKIKKFIVKEFS